MLSAPLPSAVPAGIPYESFPEIAIGPVTIQTFGLCVAVGVLVGGVLTARRNARLGISGEQTERIVIWLVLAGLLGARLLWVVTSLDQIRPFTTWGGWYDVVAVWEGGLQFSGGFIAALLVAPWATRRLSREQRWHMLDGAAIGLTIGMAFGRIGCYAVGEHFGGPTSFFLGITYQGGRTIEGQPNPVEGQPDLPLVVGETYWSHSVLEFLYLLVILAVLLVVDRRGVRGAGTLAGVFSVGYAIARFGTDFVRVNDETLLGLTGAQYMCLGLLGLGAWFLWTARRRESPQTYLARLAKEDGERAEAAALGTGESEGTAETPTEDGSGEAGPDREGTGGGARQAADERRADGVSGAGDGTRDVTAGDATAGDATSGATALKVAEHEDDHPEEAGTTEAGPDSDSDRPGTADPERAGSGKARGAGEEPADGGDGTTR